VSRPSGPAAVREFVTAVAAGTARGAAGTMAAAGPVLCALVTSSDMTAGATALAERHGIVTISGGASARGIGNWDGSEWQSLGGGMHNTVRALTVYNGDLIAAGLFQNAGGQSAHYVARWDGSNWHPLASNINGSGSALVVFNGELIMGASHEH
jgi:hypothetical protein